MKRSCFHPPATQQSPRLLFMRTTFRLHNGDSKLTVPAIVSSFSWHSSNINRRHTIDLTGPRRTTDTIENLEPIWTETGHIVPPRRNPWRATRGNRVSRHLSNGRRDFQFHFLCSLSVSTAEIPESELVSHHLTFSIPTTATDISEETERLHSFIQIADHSFADKHFAVQA